MASLRVPGTSDELREVTEDEAYRVLGEITLYEQGDLSDSAIWQVCKFHHRCKHLPFYRFLEEEVSDDPLEDECLDFCEGACASKCGDDDTCFEDCFRRCEGGV